MVIIETIKNTNITIDLKPIVMYGTKNSKEIKEIEKIEEKEKIENTIDKSKNIISTEIVFLNWVQIQERFQLF